MLPATTWVEVGDGRLRSRFGWWRLETSLDNVAHVETSGGYSFVKTAGPPHLSFSDRGVTFATNGERGVCVAFHDPVPAIDPLALQAALRQGTTEIRRIAGQLRQAGRLG